MRHALRICTTLGLLGWFAAFSGVSAAKGPPKALDVTVTISSTDGQISLEPSALRFERGQFYRLLIANATDKSRYFTASGLASRVFTRKVEVLGADGQLLAEIHGQANNMELAPGARVAWYFFPMINVDASEMRTRWRKQDIAVGSITIFGSAPIIKPRN